MRIVMLGTGAFAEPTFETLLTRPRSVVGLFTQPDRVVGQERGSTRQTGRGMKTIAQEHHIPVFQPEKINTPEGAGMLRSLAPDLMVVAAYGQIFKDFILAIPARGAVNVHASLLPKYRGAAPIVWAIYHGEKRTGVTIFRLTTGIDTGEMLVQEAIDIGPSETAGDVEQRLSVIGARLVLDVVDRLSAGEVISGVKQDDSQASRAPKLTKENGLIDWNGTNEQVCNHIRAMQPWPTAYTFLRRAEQPPVRLIITRAVAFPVRYDPTVPAGTPFTDERLPEYLFVTAGLISDEERSVVKILELQPAGKKRMSAAEFLRGRRPLPGDRLGPETP